MKQMPRWVGALSLGIPVFSALAIWACSNDSSTSSGSPSSAPTTTGPGTPNLPPAPNAPSDSGAPEVPEVLSFDAVEGAKRAVRSEGHGISSVATVKALLSAFAEDDPTLDLAKSAAANAAAVKDRIQSEACASVSIAYTTGSVTLSVDFGTGCTLKESGLTVAGKVEVTVSKTGGDGGTSADGGGTTLALEFKFTDVSADGYTFNGTAKVSTSDLKTYQLSTNLTLSGKGTLTYSGPAQAAMESDGGADASAIAVTLNGDGTWTGSTPSSSDQSVSGCQAQTSTLKVASLHRSLNKCHPDNGTITVVTPYTCTYTVKRQSVTRTVTSTSVITYSSTTPSTGEVTVTQTVTGTTTDSGAGTSQTVALPGGACK